MKLSRSISLRFSCKPIALPMVCMGLVVALPMLGQGRLSAKPQITQAVDVAKTVRIPGSVHVAVTRATDLGAVSADLSMERMMLVLQPSPERSAALTQLLDDQQNVMSPHYHRWLTPQQFAEQFGPAASDVQQVQAWLQSQGLQVTRVANGGWWMQFSGNAQQVSKAFGTSIHNYSVNGQTRTANASAISIPAALAPAVAGVLSLHNFPKLPNHTKVQSVVRSASGQLVPATGQADTTAAARTGSVAQPQGTFSGGATHYISPGDMAAIYNTNPLLKQSINGAGISIAVIGQSDIQLADIQTFRSIFNLPPNDPQIIVDGNDPGVSSDDEEESDLDLEYAGALAPQAKILFVTSAGTVTTSGIDLSLAYAVDNALAPIISLSYGECEAEMNTAGNAFQSLLWQQAASEGITAFVSSGDSGSAGCDGGGQPYSAVFGLQVSGLASTPYNVAVGGTTLAEGANASTYWNTQNGPGYTSAIGYIPEVVWNDSCSLTAYPAGCVYSGGQTVVQGGGGGVSTCTTATFGLAGYTCSGGYAKPAWQTGPGVPADGKRDVPDVSLASSGDHDGYLVCTEGSCQTAYQNGVMTLQTATIIGGTSAAAPSMAGIMALVEQKNGSFQGQANYTFYKLAAMQDTAACNSSNQTTPGAASTCVFHDVTVGSNAPPCFGSTTDCLTTVNGQIGLLAGYNAGAGYDAATGLGSVDANNLANAWQTAGQAASTMKLSFGAGTAVHGQPVPFTATVAPVSGNGTPGGDFSLSGSGQSVGPFTLTGGTYAGTTNSLPGGTYTVTAHYAGDASFSASTSNPAKLTITPEAGTASLNLYYYNVFTAGTVAVQTGAVPFGAPLYYLTQVQGVSGQGVATGNVTFTLDGASLGAYPLDAGGQAAVDYSVLGLPYVLPGTHSVVASFAGDTSFKAATSPAAPLTVSKGAPYTYAIPNVSSLVQGQPVQILMHLSNIYTPLPTGSMQIFDNGVALGAPLPLTTSGPLGSGIPQAAYTTSSLAVGPHVFTASYSGDAVYGAVAATASAASTASLSVTAAKKLTSSLSLVASSTSVAVGQSIQYTVKVTPTTAGGPVPTGTITLSDPNPGGVFAFTIAPAAALTNGALTSTQTFYGGGNLLVFASYSGDSNYEAAVSPTVLSVYTPVAPTAQLSANAAYTLPGTQSSITVQVTGHPNQPLYPIPGGVVQYFDSLNGGATTLLGTHYLSVGNGNVGVDTLPALLATGSHQITAKYLGDANWSSLNTSAVTVVVTNPDFNMTTPTGTTPATLGVVSTATITATPELTYSGTVAFACTGGLPVGASCNFAPATVSTSGVPVSTVLNLSTTAPTVQTSANLMPGRPGEAGSTTVHWAGIAALAALLLAGVGRRRWKGQMLSALLVGVVASGLLSGCSNSSTSTAAATVSLRSDYGTKAALGSSVSFTATVSVPDSKTPSWVRFMDGTTQVGFAYVTGSKASAQISTLAVGTHPITAVYQSSEATGTIATSPVLQQGITGTAVVQVTGTSASLSHTINVSYLLQ